MAAHLPQALPASAEEHRQFLQSHARFKEHSFSTSKEIHTRLLLSEPTNNPDIVLLGDSMIERMQTTGNSHNFQPWPAESMLNQSTLDSLKDSSGAHIIRLNGVFNAGVGGDKYENIIYRLIGGSSEGRDLPGLMDIFMVRDVKLWIVCAGTDNLHRKRGLSGSDVDSLRLILRALLAISKPETQILLNGLFYRKDISDQLVDEANLKLESAATSVNTSLGSKRVSFLPATTRVNKDVHLVDHVHLNEDGYRLWAEYLIGKSYEMLKEVNLVRGASI